MVVFKIADFNLYESQWQSVFQMEDDGHSSFSYKNHPLVPGSKVCSGQKLETMGIITDVGHETDIMTPYKSDAWQHNREYVKEVTVFWLTGPKKGRTEKKVDAQSI